jgi:hemolysin III
MTRGERFNCGSHLAGAVLALVGVVALVWQTAGDGDPWKVTAAGVYGFTLVGLYTSSSLHHGLRGRAREVLRTLDHTSIYLLIAGTYTPFALVTLRGPLGFSILAVVWALALTGAARELAPVRRARALRIGSCLALGWLAVAILPALARALPSSGLNWVLAGGALYSVGVVFYALDERLAWGHGAFHLFVLAGSASHYFAILLYVA